MISPVSQKRLIHQDEQYVVFYKAGRFFISTYTGEKYTVQIPFGVPSTLLVQNRLLERALRLEPRVAIVSNEILYFSCKGIIYRYDLRSRSFLEKHKLRIGMSNPLAFSVISNMDGFTNGIVYGEYWANTEKDRVSIYRCSDKWERVFTFPSNTITHIHGFVCDRYRKRILILTGDDDSESGIWETYDDFATVTQVLVGKQQFRSCVAFAEEDGVLYVTDTPLEQNAIYYLHDGEGGKRIEKIQDISGPCIFGKSFFYHGKTQYVIATSVEPDSRIKGIRYQFTNILGPGVKDRFVHVYVGDADAKFREIGRLKKDLWPMGLGQFGNVRFPETLAEDYVTGTGQAISKRDGTTFNIVLDYSGS